VVAALSLTVPAALLARTDEVIENHRFAASAHDRLWH